MQAPVANPVASACFRRASVRETAILLLVAWLVPFVVHLVPWSGARPLGAHLLPMFWAGFVATYFFGPVLGAVVGIFAPAINLVVTGLPALPFAGTMSAELVLFAGASAVAVRLAPRFIGAAPLAYVVAKVLTTVAQGALSGAGGFVPHLQRLPGALTDAAAGLVILAGLNYAVVAFYPKPAKGDEAAGV